MHLPRLFSRSGHTVWFILLSTSRDPSLPSKVYFYRFLKLLLTVYLFNILKYTTNERALVLILIMFLITHVD